ncbi:hypothetical protein CHLRE_16g677800v5 [Chlamydomonas reinhardtii]|uniref:TraB domain-containing protein n=1 Tax=Chlamydomonas reinhardtii TaxID=3055 RepID=A0A2K3CVA3_CHLRE|nr:uncharacterized protein CHLRE_16g677800v5 [Chlamydomonas reinhardtii]PNW72207.1 hypothetical protein CHLRE_16g677800v5 [Chlamydomonas reinhardtii]
MVPSVATSSTTITQQPTHDPELVAELLKGPPEDFDFRAELTQGSREWVAANAPHLLDLVDDGTLLVVPRRHDYVERRSDGYTEPRVVLLVGTAHVSRRSQLDVDRVIRAVRPDSVVVELCKSRSAALAAQPLALVEQQQQQQQQQQHQQQNEAARSSGSGSDTDDGADRKASGLGTSTSSTSSSGTSGTSGSGTSTSTSTSGTSSSGNSASAPPGAYINPMNLGGGGGSAGGGAGFAGAVARSVSLGGQSALLLRVLLAGLAKRTAGSLGVAGGGEFAAAQAAADAVGAQVVLGDRPVEITLSRAWAALGPLTRRAALCADLLKGAVGSPQQALSEELVERLKSDDAVSAFFKQLSSSYPELVAPLITERDLYLAWSLKRSKAVCGTGTVVGVVGRGHLRGVAHALLRDRGGAGLRFSDLVEGRNSRRVRRRAAAEGAARLAAELALGAGAYVAWLAYNGEL